MYEKTVVERVIEKWRNQFGRKAKSVVFVVVVLVTSTGMSYYLCPPGFPGLYVCYKINMAELTAYISGAVLAIGGTVRFVKGSRLKGVFRNAHGEFNFPDEK